MRCCASRCRPMARRCGALYGLPTARAAAVRLSVSARTNRLLFCSVLSRCRRARPVALRVLCAAPDAALLIPCAVPDVVLLSRFAAPVGAPFETSVCLWAGSWGWRAW